MAGAYNQYSARLARHETQTGRTIVSSIILMHSNTVMFNYFVGYDHTFYTFRSSFLASPGKPDHGMGVVIFPKIAYLSLLISFALSITQCGYRINNINK